MNLEQKEKTEHNGISWTPEEFRQWVNSGIIPNELLSPSMQRELCKFMIENKEKLHAHYRRNPEQDHYQITMPPQEELDKAYELQVIDRRTGEVVKILEKGANFDLCDGVTLQIRAKEFEEWEKETAPAKKLTKEQNEELKSFVTSFGKDRPLTRKEIVTFLEEVRKPKKKQKNRIGGHYLDKKLEYEYPKDKQLSLFDKISPQMANKIEELKIEITTVGIRLTPSEDKLMNAIYKLLHEKSENRNKDSELFYSGNEQHQVVPYGGTSQEAKAVMLRLKPTELYKEYVGEDEYSGKEISNIKSVLYGLNQKKFLIIYDRKRVILNGKTKENRTDRIEEFASLIHIVSYIEDMTDAEVQSLNKGEDSVREKKGELIIALNPLLTDQISSKYVEYPTDINKRTMIASGGHLHVTESINALRDYMLREMSNKRYKCEINFERLPYVLKLDNYIKNYRKKLIQQRVDGAIKAVRNLGIILDVEITDGARGQKKYIFTLNKDFE